MASNKKLLVADPLGAMFPQSKSVINENHVDINRLEREIKQDVAAFQRNTAEDSMKKRAIHASGSYDEFRKFVSVSQLKPTPGRDVSSLFSGGSVSLTKKTCVTSNSVHGGRGTIGGFNHIIQKRKEARSPSTSTVKQVLENNMSVPTNSSEENMSTVREKSSREVCAFLNEWKQHCSTAKDTLLFLARTKDGCDSFESQLILQPDLTCDEYFSTDINSDILGNIVEALHLLLCMKRNDDSANGNAREDSGKIPELFSSESNVLMFAHGWLGALRRCSRFELNALFLTPHQQLKLKEIRDYF